MARTNFQQKDKETVSTQRLLWYLGTFVRKIIEINRIIQTFEEKWPSRKFLSKNIIKNNLYFYSKINHFKKRLICCFSE